MTDIPEALRCPSCWTPIVEWWRESERVWMVGGRPRKSIGWMASDPDWTCAFCDYSVTRPSEIANALDSIPVG